MGLGSTDLDGSHGSWICPCDSLFSRPMMGHGLVGHVSVSGLWPLAMLSAVV